MREAGTTGEVLQEQAGYFNVPGAHLYTVLHPVAHPVARVLLIGPFAPERQFSYHHWTRWARYLAAKRCEVVRFDYRGTGESTGDFGSASFEQWCADAEALASWLVRQRPELPLLLHGVELGAVLAGRSFYGGAGEALLLWSPPPNANQAMRAILRRWAGIEQLYESPENRKSASEYIRGLEGGLSIEVHGYAWQSKLWRESFAFGIPDGLRDEGAFLDDRGRPVKVERFGSNTEPPTMPYRRYDDNQDLSALYDSTYKWVAEALQLKAHGVDGTSH